MKSDYNNIKISDYAYLLPPERIARYPLTDRDRSKLLLWDGRDISDHIFTGFPGLVDQGTLLVFNNTRVIRARLVFRKASGARIELFCLEPFTPGDFSLNLSSGGAVEWKCLIGNLKRWKGGLLEQPFTYDGKEYLLTASRTGSEGDASIVRFSWNNDKIPFSALLESLGHMPIPPYLNRDDEPADTLSYQTTYASVSGSVAAPTAGLHFTPAIIDALRTHGAESAEVTLHVSAGTFRPVKAELIGDHMMHTEHFFVSSQTLERLKGRKVLAVGTTTVRTLESLYWLGIQAVKGRLPADGIPFLPQWEAYSSEEVIEADEAIEALLRMMKREGKDTLEARTGIIIVPGYRFRIVNQMLTNFHQPHSTLLLLVAAFAGQVWRDIYSHALSGRYRFLSYGDSMLLKP